VVILPRHFPTQNPAKIRPSKSSLVTSPVILAQGLLRGAAASSAAQLPGTMLGELRRGFLRCGSRARARASRLPAAGADRPSVHGW